MLSDPEETANLLPMGEGGDVAFWFGKHHRLSFINVINGAQSLQPLGLRPIASLSTLDLWRYRQRPKTRYEMGWVGPFSVILSTTSC